MNKLKFSLLLFLLIVVFHSISIAQNNNPQKKDSDSCIFWEISGNGLKSPSYLFGTFHLITNSFVDTIPLLMQKFKECKTFAGELKLDSTVMPKMQSASLLKGTTLDKVLSKEDYEATDKYLKELSGYDLASFNNLNPMTIAVLLTAYLQQKLMPQSPSNPEQGMDSYFQTLSEQTNKQIIGLETIDEQINALFTQFTIERQAEMLMEMVNERKEMEEHFLLMINSYKSLNLSMLGDLMYDESFKKSEIEVLLDNRNANWVKKLPGMMQNSSVFIAVGALHLQGQKGLVSLLRAQGYTVKAIKI